MSAKPTGAARIQGGAAAQGPIGAAPLGKNAKSISPPKGIHSGAAIRAQRWMLQAAARSLLLWEGKKAGLEHPANFHRTAKCKHVTHAADVGVHLAQKHDAAFYSGLITCGSVWACPVCAAKVQERRREEIAAAITWAHRAGLQPVMVTLTFPHRSWDKLGQLLEQQADALTRLRGGAPWQRFRKNNGYQGLIRGLETTFGQNGWHPHTHEIWFVSRAAVADLSTPEKADNERKIREKYKDKGYPEIPADCADMRSQILKRWRSSCARAGLLDLGNPDQVAAFNAHSVDVKGWCDASDYIAKMDESRHWGADRELAKASTKAGRLKGKHPFGLLADAAEGNRGAAFRYLEYVEAMHGKRQLFWSAGLKAKVGVSDISDEELADQEREKADILGRLTLGQWKRVRDAEKRAELLEAAESGGWGAVLLLLAGLQKQPPPKWQGPRLISSG